MAASPVRLSVVHPGGVATNIARNSRTGVGMTDNARRAQSIERFDAVARTTPAAAALRIINGIENNQPRILIGNDARFMDLLQRFRPATYWSALARRIEKATKANEFDGSRSLHVVPANAGTHTGAASRVLHGGKRPLLQHDEGDYGSLLSQGRRICRVFVRNEFATDAIFKQHHLQAQLRDLAADLREVYLNFPPSEIEGAGNAGRPMRPQPRVSVESTRVSHHGHTGNTRHSPRNGFNGLFRALPGTGLFAPVVAELNPPT